MSLKNISDAQVHRVVAELIESGEVPPDGEVVSVAIAEEAGWRAVLSITKYDGPGMPLTPAEIAAIKALEPAVRTSTPGRPDIALTDLQQRILGVCDGKPKKATVIAARLGVACSGSFRGTLAMLVRFGVLVWDGGYKRPDVR